MTNRLITFEGIEGSGKTSQIKLAGQCLARAGVPFITTGEPGGTPLGEKIREILLTSGNWAISGEAELFLFLAARSQHVRDVIRPALEEGKWVLCDRFSDATIAYQGFGRGLDIGLIKSLHDFASSGLTPALTILLDLPVERGLARALGRIAQIRKGALEDRFEKEELAFHRKIREGYLALAGQAAGRYRIIDADRDVGAIHRDVCLHLEEFIASPLPPSGL